MEKTSCSNKSQENVGYERLIQSAWAPPTNCKPDNGIVSAPFATTNWDDGDSFSSDEFSDCDEDEWKPTTPEPVSVPQQQRKLSLLLRYSLSKNIILDHSLARKANDQVQLRNSSPLSMLASCFLGRTVPTTGSVNRKREFYIDTR